MDTVFGILIVFISLLGWGGQAISLAAPSTAERWKLTEAETSVDSVFYSDIRGEVLWDTLTLWVMPLAGALLVAGVDAWAPIGLVAGGMYVYFGGRGVFTAEPSLSAAAVSAIPNPSRPPTRHSQCGRCSDSPSSLRRR